MPKKNKASAVIGAAMFVTGFLGTAFVSPAGGIASGINVAHAAVSDWQKGVNISPNNNTDFSSSNFEQSVRNAAGVGINYIFLDIPLYQSNIYSTDLQTGWNTPTDQSLAAGINFIHSLGLHAALKFEIFPYDGQWSAYINPSDRASWFNNYGNMLRHYASISASTGAEELVLGTELTDMSTQDANPSNTSNWKSLIGSIRSIYSGKLTYSANWGDSGFSDEADAIQFWSSLDYIGISAYYNLNGDGSGSVSSIMQSWSGWDSSRIAPLSSRWGKPVIFTEVGYKSIWDSFKNPWMWWESGGAAPGQQANDYQALFEYWNDKPYMQGVALWYWSSDPNAGGSGNIDYTPQNKAAQDIMRSWFGAGSGGSGNSGSGGSGSGGNGGSSGASSSNSAGTFKESATLNPASPAPGSNSTISIAITDADGASNNVIADAEIYDPGGARMFQKIFSGENFSNNGTNNYSISWTPASAGSYILKIGMFSSDWGTLYSWNNGVLNVAVGSGGDAGGNTGGGGTSGGSSGSGGGSGGTAAGSINIWWPTNGSTISGVQPFKAMLTNNDVSSYNMSWDVDDGQKNKMYNDSTNYPHKQAMVDVSPWQWQGSGNYKITFTAQDTSGKNVAQSTITIHIAH